MFQTVKVAIAIKPEVKLDEGKKGSDNCPNYNSEHEEDCISSTTSSNVPAAIFGRIVQVSCIPILLLFTFQG